MQTNCTRCGKDDELRLGICFDCADTGESNAASRSVIQHLSKAVRNATQRKWEYAWYDLTWAWQRANRSGDYKAGGYFDKKHPGWSNPTS